MTEKKKNSILSQLREFMMKIQLCTISEKIDLLKKSEKE